MIKCDKKAIADSASDQWLISERDYSHGEWLQVSDPSRTAVHGSVHIRSIREKPGKAPVGRLNRGEEVRGYCHIAVESCVQERLDGVGQTANREL